MKTVLQLFQKVLKVAFPHSRWGNVAYLAVGFYLAHIKEIHDLIVSISKLFGH